MSIYHNSDTYLSTGGIYGVISLVTRVQFYLDVETYVEQTAKYIYSERDDIEFCPTDFRFFYPVVEKCDKIHINLVIFRIFNTIGEYQKYPNNRRNVYWVGKRATRDIMWLGLCMVAPISFSKISRFITILAVFLVELRDMYHTKRTYFTG